MHTQTDKPAVHNNFIRDIIIHDLETKKHDYIVTRFPPEPNGYLHIGHAKAFCLSFGLAKEFNGECHLRFDDTNPVKEDEKYVKAIQEDIKWMGWDWGEHLYYASDYFDKIYEYSIEMIKLGKAYVDEQTADEIRKTRGTLTEPGIESPYRDRPIEENLELFEKMKNGEFPDGSKVLRAKIDMNHPNLNMRDPVMYRILHATHHNTGDKWCIYPMYDWAHGLEDSIENITHSLCDLDFENHRPLYDWFLAQLPIHKPRQIEFSRLNLSYTVMSKRLLIQLIEMGAVKDWDDPRMPTISGMRRRGYPAVAIRNFLETIGITKYSGVTDIALLEHAVRDVLNPIAYRYMGVMEPLKVVIENYPEDQTEELTAINNPADENSTTRTIPFSREIYVERSDFMEDAPKKFFRLSVGREVRLRYAYLVTCTDVIKDDEGNVIELRCTYDPESRGGNAPDGRRVKGTIHWVSAKDAVDATVNLYDRLFTVENPTGDKEKPFTEFINPDSLKTITAKVEPAVKTADSSTPFQFERTGYFIHDTDSTSEAIILNRTVPLRDSWAKKKKNHPNNQHKKKKN